MMKRLSLENDLINIFMITLPFIAVAMPFTGISLSYFPVFLLAIIWVYKGAGFPADKLSVLFYVFFSFSIFSMLTNLLHVNPFLTSTSGDILYLKDMKQFFMVVIALLHYIVLKQYLKTVDCTSIHRFNKTLVTITKIITFYCVYQFIGVIYKLPLVDILRNSTQFSLVTPAASYGWMGWVGFDLPRTWGFTPEPSFWGAFLLIPLSYVLPLVSRNISKQVRFSFLILLIALLLSFSRSAWGAFAIIVVYHFFKKIRLRFRFNSARNAMMWLLIFAVAVPLLYVFVISKNLNSYITAFTFQDWSSLERFSTQIKAIKLFSENPLIGIGWGNTPFFLTSAMDNHSVVTYNFYLQILLETGIIGFILFLILLALMWVKVLRIEKSYKHLMAEANVRQTILGTKYAYISILFVWMNMPSYSLSYFWWIFALIAALPDIMINTATEKK